jgi:hypothetical protein
LVESTKNKQMQFEIFMENNSKRIEEIGERIGMLHEVIVKMENEKRLVVGVIKSIDPLNLSWEHLEWII